MSRAPRCPQDIYARQLSSEQGYPLWMPDPSQELLTERRDGLRIGDVGVVLKDGGFDVFFNICLPADHPFHRRHGVPEGFTCIGPDLLDFRTNPNAERPGRIVSSCSVTRDETFNPSNDPSKGRDSSAPPYRFNLSSSEGALLILPEGAQQHDLLNEDLFLEQASLHGTAWYNYAVNRRRRIINPDSLYLITGLHKTRAWSVAAFENSTDKHHTAYFKQVEGGGRSNSAGPSYGWETSCCAMHWRVGPYIDLGVPNQTVYIRGFKIALRNGFLGTRRISVKADVPSTRWNRVKATSMVSRNWVLGGLAKLLRFGGHRASRATQRGQVTEPATEDMPNIPDHSAHVEVQRVPDTVPVFHPSDAIHRYLFEKDPSVNIAITHDSHWISLLEDGSITLEGFGEESHLEAVLSDNYEIVSREGVVYLKRRFEVSDLSSPRESVPPSPAVVDVIVQPPTRSSATPFTTRPSTLRLRLIEASSPATHALSQSSGEESGSVGLSLFSFHPGSHSSNTLNTECTEDDEDYVMDQLPFQLPTASVVRRHDYPTHRGFYGDVWQCDLLSEEPQNSRKVAVKAVKIPQNGRAYTPSQEKRLRREIRVWLHLDHGNIVPLLGIVADFGPLPSMVSPWYRNGSLSCYLSARRSPLPAKRQLMLLGDIAAGLCYLHDKGIIHGGLHGDNVLIGDNGRARLTDFGLSFVQEFVGTPYLSSSICGAVQFADPALVKRAESSQDVVVYPTKPCDVYSFGGLMLHVLSGRKPYSQLVYPDMIRKISEEERPEIPAEVTLTKHRVLMQRCWDREESRRPFSRELVRRFAQRN